MCLCRLCGYSLLRKSSWRRQWEKCVSFSSVMCCLHWLYFYIVCLPLVSFVTVSLAIFVFFFYWASSTLSISVVFNILSSFYFPLLLSLSLSFSRQWAVCSLLHVDTVALAIIGRKKEKQKRQGKKWDGEKGRRVVAARGPGQCLLLILVVVIFSLNTADHV